MRKRRRLADKLTISVCAVLVAVSAFFYAPMDVRAEESINVSSVQTLSVDEVMTAEVASEVGTSASEDLELSSGYFGRINLTTDSFVMATGLNSDSVYKVDLTIDSLITPSVTGSGASLRAYAVIWNNVYNFVNANALGLDEVRSSTVSRTVYLTGDVLMSERYFTIRGVVTNSKATTLTLDFDYNITIDSITEVSNSASDEYQNGYNAGYSAGEQAGYGNGYSNGFADGEASVDTNEIYNQGFNAGKDSVDTQSFYDAGYQAGYQVAYQEGYDSGYDEGYQSAINRMDGWGADTSDYPVLVYDDSVLKPRVLVECMSNIPGISYGSTSLFHLDYDFNPNHTYKFVFDSDGFYTDATQCLFSSDDLGYVVGGLRVPARYTTSWGTNTVFISGDRVSSVVNLDAYVYEMRFYDGPNEPEDFYLAIGRVSIGTHGSVSLKIFDMGPSGDTQNHIANQTDKLTNGFNDSKGNSVNNDFSSGLNDFETAEDSLFATATTGLKDFTFFDFQSVPAMVTGMSFVGSIMSGWFTQAGGASGVGIVLSILFSIMLVAMVLGLYRWYQSKGGKD